MTVSMLIYTNFFLIMSRVITDPALISQAIEIINDSIDTVLKDEADVEEQLASGYAWFPGRDLIWGSDGDMPQCGSPSDQGGSSTPLSRVPSSYKCDVDIIYDLFDSRHYTSKGEITLTLVMQRLSLIDLHYSTNLTRFKQFGIFELAYQICALSATNSGQFDHVLAEKARDFVSNPSTDHRIYEELFNREYGIPREMAVSIISKYLFFLLEVQGCPKGSNIHFGFPIYDSVVKELLPKLGAKIGITIVKSKIKNIVAYIEAIKAVALKLKLDVKQHDGLSVFGVLDFFLWRIGKVGNLSFSLLLTYDELKYVYGLKDEDSPHVLLAAFPSRFQRWWRIYQYIINLHNNTIMSAKVKVSAKSQNRTALGIVHAYCAINPDCSLEQLQQAFPSSLCPDSGVKQLLLPVEQAQEFNTKMSLYFTKDGEPVILSDGTAVALAQIWSGASLQRMVQHAAKLDIDAAAPNKADTYGPAGFNLYILAAPTPEKRSFWQEIIDFFKKLGAKH